ncbi:hypothetical protein LTR85_008938 [Meristemomyces frigidus]|nr:hypothetical protein LTR85_008938 [Meristemomyces frigidus]
MSRLLREIAIDGTKALGGKQSPPRNASGDVYKSGGGYWQNLARSAKVSTKRKRAEAISGEPATKKSRQTVHKPSTSPKSASAPAATRKRKRPANDDETFLRAAQSQLKKVKTADAKRIRPYLTKLRQPTAQEAHTLSEAAARRLLAGNNAINRPVFVVSGDANNILDPEDDRRPIEQLFTWLANDDETHDLYLPGEAANRVTAPGTIKTAALRQRFEAHNGPVQDGKPHNLTDLANPFPVTIAPKFTQTPACNLLGDVMRYLFDCGINDLCQAGCPDRLEDAPQKCCEEHFLTTTEFAELQTGWRQWQGAISLAEAGALTQPHVDKWGFATNTICLEGEIGWCWLADPTNDEREGLSDGSDDTRDSGRWVYKVLRPGDVMYMPPGTPHMVFRLPNGRQTMVAGSHILRRRDVEQWANWIELEARHAQKALEEGEQLDDSEAGIWRGLAEGIEHVLEHTNGPAASYGGLL